MSLRRAFAKVPKSVAIASVSMAVAAAAITAGPIGEAFAFAPGSGSFVPGDLLVSTSTWAQDANITAGTTQLPPNCGGATYPDATCSTAVTGGAYPYVFDNDAVDGSFGVAQPIVIDEITPSGSPVDSVTIPNSAQPGITPSSDQMATSFSSKSELALNQSTDGSYFTFMGYNAAVGSLDNSNADTPDDIDPTNIDSANPTYRVVDQMDQYGNSAFTETNAYAGNNGRAAILDPATKTLFTAGNAGNGSKPEPQGVVQGAGSQIMSLASGPESSQSPGQPTPAGNFNAATELGDSTDKTAAKDDNFRGLTTSNGVLYFSKGSGSNGVDTVYFLDTTGTACPSGGVGVPAAGATLPTAGSFTSPTYTANGGNPELTPTNMCVLSGFPTALAKSAPATGTAGAFDFPFGIWLANSTTMYVADEGSGDATYSPTAGTGGLGQYTIAAGQTNAGLQKWSFNGTKWVLDYVLQNGLNLGQPYGVSGYPSGLNTYTVGSNTTTVGQQWDPAVDGLRNLTGQVNGNGTVSIWAATSTVSGSGDQGADPNSLVSITDNLSTTTLPGSESFSTVMAPTSGQVIRGVTFAPTTAPDPALPEVPWAPLLPIAAAIGGGVFYVARRRRVGALS